MDGRGKERREREEWGRDGEKAKGGERAELEQDMGFKESLSALHSTT